MFLPNINRTHAAERAQNAIFCPWWPWHLTLMHKLDLARDQTHLQCKFGANPFSGSQDISYTNKKPQTDGTKNRNFCSSLRAVKTKARFSCLLRDPTWKQRRPILISAFHKFVSYLLTYGDTYTLTYSPGPTRCSICLDTGNIHKTYSNIDHSGVS